MFRGKTFTLRYSVNPISKIPILSEIIKEDQVPDKRISDQKRYEDRYSSSIIPIHQKYDLLKST